MATTTQVHPQGYHRYGFGQFVPHVSFKAKQFAPVSKKPNQGASTNVHYSRSGLSLPQISVRKLYNHDPHRRKKKKLSKSCDNHLLCSESDHFRQLPDLTASKRDKKGISSNDRVIENGTSWWKWSKKEYHVKPTSFKNRSSLTHFDQTPTHYHNRGNIRNKHYLPSVSSRAVDVSQEKTKSHCVTNRPLYAHSEYHPSYYGTLHPNYFDRERDMNYFSNGSLTTQYSPITHNNDDTLRIIYDKALKMRYYYSRSRCGIRPVLSGRHPKANSLYLVDFNSRDPMSSSIHHRISKRTYPHRRLAVTTASPSEQISNEDSRFNVRHKDTKASSKVDKVLIPSYTIDSSILDNQHTLHQSRKLLESRMKVRNLQIELLDEMIALLEKTNYTAESTASLASYLDSREATPTHTGASVRFAVTNLMDFFEMPESELKKYDNLLRSKMLEKLHKTHGFNTGKVSEGNRTNTESTSMLTQQQLLLAVKSLSTVQQGEDLDVPRNGSQNSFQSTSNLVHLRQLSKYLGSGLTSENEDLRTVIKNLGLPESLAVNVSMLLRTKGHRKFSDSTDSGHREKRPNPYPDIVINGESFKSLQEMLLQRDLEREMARKTHVQGQGTEDSEDVHFSEIDQERLSRFEEETYHDGVSLNADSSLPYDDCCGDEEMFHDECVHVVEALDRGEKNEQGGDDQPTDIHQFNHHDLESTIDPVYFNNIVKADLNEKLQMHRLEQETMILQSVKDDLKYLKETLNGKVPPRPDKTPEQSQTQQVPDIEDESNSTTKESDKNEAFLEHACTSVVPTVLEQGDFGSMDSSDGASCSNLHPTTASGDSQTAGAVEITCNSDNENSDQLSDVEEDDETSDVFDTKTNDHPDDTAFLAVPSTTAVDSSSSLTSNRYKKTPSSKRKKSSTTQPVHKNFLKKGQSSSHFSKTGNTSLKRTPIPFPRSEIGHHRGTPPWSQRSPGLSQQQLHSGRLRTPGTPEFKTALMHDIGEISAVVNTIRDMVGPLEISRPTTVKGLDTERRTSTSKGRRSGLSTQGASRQRHSLKSEEPSNPEEVEESDFEWRLKQKRQKQLEWELQQSFEIEKIEIMKRRKKMVEAKRETEQREVERHKVVNEIGEQELLKLAQEKERHLLQLERLKQEAEMRHCLQLYEQSTLEEYDHTQSVWNETDYARITYYFGEGFSKRQREIEKALELQAMNKMEKSFLEALDLKREELIHKLKAAQEEFMKGLTIESESVNHLLQISKAFVYSYFKAVPSQTYRVPEEAAM